MRFYAAQNTSSGTLNPSDRKPPLPTFTLRPLTPVHAEYFYALCEATMRGHVEATWGHWDEAKVRRELTRLVGDRKVSGIHVGSTRVGALVCDRDCKPIVVEQLYLAPEHQRCGIGSAVMGDLLARASSIGSDVTLDVLRVNPARAFYAQIGFEVTHESAYRYAMRWRPVNPS